MKNIDTEIDKELQRIKIQRELRTNKLVKLYEKKENKKKQQKTCS